MENATKALLIAAAILIAIVLISLGVYVLGQGTTMVKDNSDMSDVEISTYNSKFEAYTGSNVTGSKVKQLIKAVEQHNRSNEDDESRTISFNGDLDTVEEIQSGKAYKVTVEEYTSGGLIFKIKIEERS